MSTSLMTQTTQWTSSSARQYVLDYMINSTNVMGESIGAPDLQSALEHIYHHEDGVTEQDLFTLADDTMIYLTSSGASWCRRTNASCEIFQFTVGKIKEEYKKNKFSITESRTLALLIDYDHRTGRNDKIMMEIPSAKRIILYTDKLTIRSDYGWGHRYGGTNIVFDNLEPLDCHKCGKTHTWGTREPCYDDDLRFYVTVGQVLSSGSI